MSRPPLCDKKVANEKLQTGYPLHRVPTAQGKQEKWPKKSLSGKHRKFGNSAKTQGIWFAEVVNSQILKVKDISILAVKISNLF